MPEEQEFNGSVLPSSHSRLISTILDPVNFELYSIDCDLMVRVWSLDAGRCLRSYTLETRDSQIKALNSGVDEEGAVASTSKKGFAKKAQLAHADEMLKFLAVCFEGGEIQINNLYTGALIYNDYNVPPLKLEYEVAKLSFFRSQTKIWIAAACFDGKVAFLSKPMVSQGRSYLTVLARQREQAIDSEAKHAGQKKKKVRSHQRDVLASDINADN